MEEQKKNTPLPVLLLSHGAGPCFFTTGGTFSGIDSRSRVASDFRSVPSHLPRKPTSVVVITAHHETSGGLELVGDPAQSTTPTLLFDYYGFPAETYALSYPGSNAPKELVQDVQKALSGAGISVKSDNARGWDHGVFIPLILMYPEGLPTLSISINQSLDPEFHHQLGLALKAVRHAHPDTLFIASGSVTHGRGGGRPGFADEHQFVDWFEEVVKTEDALHRARQIRDASKIAPHYKLCHPRSEHFVPFIVGAASSDDGSGKKIGGGWWNSLAVNIYLV
jgi:aromatic ring-opening dioxygenase catalytic subunit (LigB family)